MTDPVLVEVTRGRLVESCHRGAVAVVDVGGARLIALGDVLRPVFPRSAVKAIQAVPLVQSGAAARYGYGEEELALACASHAGEPGHLAVALRMLARCGLDPGALACGAHPPSHPASASALVRAGRRPSALHNNCSGKHAGFLCLASAMEIEHRGYASPEHPVQREVKAAIEDFTGVSLAADATAIDGCSAPTWAVPLASLAQAFARLGTGQGLAEERAKSAARLRAACAANPWLVAGTGRFATDAMTRLRERLFVKGGAEGVMCAALPELGLGIALKCGDGSSRAAEVVMAALVIRLLRLDPVDQAAFERFARPVLRNWNGIEVGALRPTPILMPGSSLSAASR